MVGRRKSNCYRNEHFLQFSSTYGPSRVQEFSKIVPFPGICCRIRYVSYPFYGVFANRVFPALSFSDIQRDWSHCVLMIVLNGGSSKIHKLKKSFVLLLLLCIEQKLQERHVRMDEWFNDKQYITRTSEMHLDFGLRQSQERHYSLRMKWILQHGESFWIELLHTRRYHILKINLCIKVQIWGPTSFLTNWFSNKTNNFLNLTFLEYLAEGIKGRV